MRRIDVRLEDLSRDRTYVSASKAESSSSEGSAEAVSWPKAALLVTVPSEVVDVIEAVRERFWVCTD